MIILGHKKTLILFTKTTFMFSENKNLTPHNNKNAPDHLAERLLGGSGGGFSPPPGGADASPGNPLFIAFTGPLKGL